MVLLKLYNHQPLLLLHRLSFKSKGSDTPTITEPGLPNITGSFGLDSDSPAPTGAFYQDGSAANADGYDSNNKFVRFDASRSSAIYGASDTVQPASLNLIPQIKY